MKRILITLMIAFAPVCFSHAEMKTPIKILLVPGHDDQVWGAQYGDLKEADMNLEVATKIFNILKKDERFKVYITRNRDGYTKDFANYFTDNREEVFSFIEKKKKETQDRLLSGDFIEKENVPHNNASEDVAIRLYGFNKWASENDIDAVIHIHFNDYPRVDKWTMGEYKGFAIYYPDPQMSNAKTSLPLAKSIFKQLKSKYPTSTYEKEKGGLISEQKLIAIGANDTLISGVRSVLIEYGYIYKFGNTKKRKEAYTKMASLTAKGIEKHFFRK
jgi:N-acetylmuramoyl-L-alanine amidase